MLLQRLRVFYRKRQPPVFGPRQLPEEAFCRGDAAPGAEHGFDRITCRVGGAAQVFSLRAELHISLFEAVGGAAHLQVRASARVLRKLAGRTLGMDFNLETVISTEPVRLSSGLQRPQQGQRLRRRTPQRPVHRAPRPVPVPVRRAAGLRCNPLLTLFSASRVGTGWRYLYRAVGSSGRTIQLMLGEAREEEGAGEKAGRQRRARPGEVYRESLRRRRVGLRPLRAKHARK